MLNMRLKSGSCRLGFVVCKIRPELQKPNTFFKNNFESYQRDDVSMLIIRILTLLTFEKVYRNENQISEK
jgi:hypothetical protein